MKTALSILAFLYVTVCIQMKILLLLLIAFLACGENEEVDNELVNTTVVPGREAVGIKLGDDLDKVKKLYGEPQLDYSRGVYETSFRWTIAYDWSDLGVTVYFDNDRAVEIGVRNAEARTTNGLSVGSTWDEVHEVYGNESNVDSGQGGALFVFADGGANYSDAYTSKGIEFRYTIKPFVVVKMVVFDVE